MKKLLFLLFVAILTQSCKKQDYFAEGNFYKIIDKKNKSVVDFTFLSDNSIAFNSDSLKNCRWLFMKFKKTDKGIYILNKEQIDTTWLKIEDEKIIIFEKNKKTILESSNFSNSKVDSILKNIKKVKKYSDQDIGFNCGYDLSEIPYFYENSVEEIKSTLKNPNTAKFKGAYISKYKDIINGVYKETDITCVSLKVEATNSFGAFTVETFYVYFTPEKNNSRKFKITSGNFPKLDTAVSELDSLYIN